jgi:hypothetical protein
MLCPAQLPSIIQWLLIERTGLPLVDILALDRVQNVSPYIGGRRRTAGRTHIQAKAAMRCKCAELDHLVGVADGVSEMIEQGKMERN